MDRIHAMQIFVRVAESGGFTRAADLLQLPRATVSMAVQQLEAQLGVRLLQRTTRRVQLTQDGTAYLERCQRLLGDFEETEALFRQAGRMPAGRLRVDVPGRIGRLLIAPALPGFFARYPDISLELGVSDRPVDLVREGVDCVVRVGELHDSGLVARRLGLLEQGNYASPAYLARYGTPKRLTDLSAHLAVHYISPANGRVLEWEYLEEGMRKTLAMNGRVAANHAETYIACAIAGQGLIQVPRHDMHAHVAAGELQEVLPEWTAPPMPISVCYPHRRHLSRRVQAFVDWMAELLTAAR
ncbi:LysR family transcriptional regulator [Chitinimonas arctica]|uniref:LysR family transcriptional regulator n=1 Tax=Chitinimonas arctica TaxID=2594795 RepID=A0A516SDI6_9NEIS|nr:LysR family transcriptional regulator [Chitinimonas arctica]QDQ26209.1 LysR family transcriptional regulator [Chitinimonas arctica]